jgi:histidyl-tRNA synthetase
MATGNALDPHALTLAEALRERCPQRRVLVHVGGGSMKSRMKKADRSGAVLALILGEDEVANRTVTLKPLRADAPQETCAQGVLDEALDRWLAE